jgi:hypothetical protein
MTSTSFFNHAVCGPGHREPNPLQVVGTVPWHIACSNTSVKPVSLLTAEQPRHSPLWPGRFAWALHKIPHSSVRKGLV